MKRITLPLLVLLIATACSSGGDGVRQADTTMAADTSVPGSLYGYPDELADTSFRARTEHDTADIDSLVVPPPPEGAPIPTTRLSQVIDSLYNCPLCRVDLDGYVGPLSVLEIQGLMLALDDAYRDQAQYAWIATEIATDPFEEIRRSAARHVDALKELFRTYGVLIPADPWPEMIHRFENERLACVQMMRQEEADLHLFEYLALTTERQDIRRVYHGMYDASLRRYLPALRICAEI